MLLYKGIIYYIILVSIENAFNLLIIAFKNKIDNKSYSFKIINIFINLYRNKRKRFIIIYLIIKIILKLIIFNYKDIILKRKV